MSTEIVERNSVANQKLVVHDNGPLSFMMDTGKFEHLQRLSKVMAFSSLLPDHLRYERGNTKNAPLSLEVVQANCFRIVNQALRWQIDPFAMVDETYVVGGKLGYQGKLVAAVVNARAGLVGRLSAEYFGSGDSRTVRISGQFSGEDSVRTIELKLSDAKTDNQMWRKDPDQKLWYSGVTKWARRHCPEIVLGVLTDDDLERIRMESSRPETKGSRLDQLANAIGNSEQGYGAEKDQPSVTVTDHEPASEEPSVSQETESSSASDEAPFDDQSQESPKEEPKETVSRFAPKSGEETKAYHLRISAEIKTAEDGSQLDEIQTEIDKALASGFLNGIRHKSLSSEIVKRVAEISGN